ncbi:MULTISPECIES: hypothetical protein [Streptomyces]|uniref:hypothetical protein n=1 Tax=Streptomyces sp. SYP-A7185 TaxID=3040076 RepID=UPI0038F78684
MSDPSKRCLSCGDSFQEFRWLTDAELAYVVSKVGRADAGSFRRCTHPGCLRVQPHFDYKRGFGLPEDFR